MNDTPLTTKQEQQLKQTLKQHAIKFDGAVPSELAEKLQQKLASQKLDPYSNDTGRGLGGRYFAIAASVLFVAVFSVWQIQVPTGNDIQSNQISNKHDTHSSNRLSEVSTSEVNASEVNTSKVLQQSEQDIKSAADAPSVLKSNKLNQEYAAVLSDLQKIKRRIVSI